MKTVAVIGGSGFIGKNLVVALRDAGYRVRNGDIREPDYPIPVETHHCDVRSAEDCRRLIRGADTVVNLAAVHRDDEPRHAYYETNVGGAKALCEAAGDEKVSRIVFTSTVAVYGLDCPPRTSEDAPVAPFNDYGRSKAQAEDVYRDWREADPTRSLQVLRPTVVFGPGNRGNVYQLLKQLHSGRFLMIGKGRNRKSMAYVENIASALTYLVERRGRYGLFNYVDTPDMDMNHLVSHVCNALRIKEPNRVPYPVGLLAGHAGDLIARAIGRPLPISTVRVRKFCAETSFSAERIREDGFEPPVQLLDGLDRSLAHEFGPAGSTTPDRSL